jgi:Mg2+-importing ATPase
VKKARRLKSSALGLSQSIAQNLLAQADPNRIHSRDRAPSFGLILDQFKSPIALIVIFAIVISIFLKG